MAKEHYNSSEGFKEFSFLKITDLCDLPVIAPFQKLNQLCDEIKYSCSLEKKPAKGHEIIKAVQN